MGRRKNADHSVSPVAGFDRLDRPLSLIARVEQMLRQAIAEERFPDGRLPTEVELAEQLGVSRETVRLAAEVLAREGLLVKIRRKGTFLHAPRLPARIVANQSAALGYFQAGYEATEGQEEDVTRVISGLMLQGALEEASRAGYRLVVRHAPHRRLGATFEQLLRAQALAGAIFASYGEEKPLRRAAGQGMPLVLLDHDVHLSRIHSVRDDSFQGARDALLYLAGLGHRRIGFINWRLGELNRWRLQGYRQGLREARLARLRRCELSVDLTRDGAGEAVEQFLGLSPRPTALYCFNNSLARLIIEELERRRLRVPEDVSVMGGGGEDVSGLACHQANWHELGRTAVQIILRVLAGPDGREPEHHLGQHSIRAGQTATAPC
jgi:DNA-binding LacI/PurR family transcriptional regulator